MPRKSQSSDVEADLTLPIDPRSPLPAILPLVPIRDTVHFPGMMFPLFVGRDKSIRALEESVGTHQHVVLVTQRSVNIEDPEPGDMYSIGIAAEIMQILKVPDGTVRVMLEGLKRVRIVDYKQAEPYFLVKIEPLPSTHTTSLKTEALMRSVTRQFESIVTSSNNIAPDSLVNLLEFTDAELLADHITWHLPSLRVEVKQELLETLKPHARLERLNRLLVREAEILEVQKDIQERVDREMGDTQREFYLLEQLKAIHHELGERDERRSEIDEYKAKVIECRMPESVTAAANKEIDRLDRMPAHAPDGVIIRSYLDLLTALPWQSKTEDNLDIDLAEAILDEDHFGLPKVKERVIEFLAVRKLAGTLKGPILCFAGPPGVGKTSLGKSIARAMNRKFHRISLGGVRDEAEIRGHRRTYIGALPGRIMQGLKHVGVNNPVFMLDEIDKLASDSRGDPSSALLEALDPEQNKEFSDHYVECPFDLSDVMFITTANLLETIPNALRDRMEVISFSSYTEEEKLVIAQRFLVPKQCKENGIQENQLTITDDVLNSIIREYTREAGVRSLEREIGKLCRKVARKIASGSVEPVTLGLKEAGELLGPKRFRYGRAEEEDQIGSATGLVYTEFGGDIVSIEVTLTPAKQSKLTLTGQLGDVMKESAQAALTYVRSKAVELKIDPVVLDTHEIHIHVPAGATPKDGPSAGITIATALVSALTGRRIHREITMTGEITLRGKVLPIGGLKEKILAAHRAGLRTVLFPKDNEADLAEIPSRIADELTLIAVENVDAVLKTALLPAG